MLPKSLYLAALWIISLLALSGCSQVEVVSFPTQTPTVTSTPIPTPTFAPLLTLTPSPPPVPLVLIDPASVRQTLAEVGGGNYLQRDGALTTALDPASQLSFAMLKPTVVRVSMDLDEWEPKAGAPTKDRFQDSGHVHATFLFLQEAKAQAPKAQIIASIFHVADWMASDPAGSPRLVLPGIDYNAVIDSISGWLMKARFDYGVEVDYISFNEANVGGQVLMVPAEQVDFIRKAGAHFKDLGLKTRFLLGDVSSQSGVSTYIPPIYAAEDVRPYLGPLSFHSWDRDADASVLRDIGAYAAENRLEVWCTEAGFDPPETHDPAVNATWGYAVDLAHTYTRVLRDTRASSLLYWEVIGTQYELSDGVTAYPALLYLRELQINFPAGAQVVKTPDEGEIPFTLNVLAARTPGGGFSVELVSTSAQDQWAVLAGLPDGGYGRVSMSEADGGRQRLQSVIVSGRQVKIKLRPNSITFLTLRP